MTLQHQTFNAITKFSIWARIGCPTPQITLAIIWDYVSLKTCDFTGVITITHYWIWIENASEKTSHSPFGSYISGVITILYYMRCIFVTSREIPSKTSCITLRSRACIIGNNISDIEAISHDCRIRNITWCKISDKTSYCIIGGCHISCIETALHDTIHFTYQTACCQRTVCRIGSDWINITRIITIAHISELG